RKIDLSPAQEMGDTHQVGLRKGTGIPLLVLHGRPVNLDSFPALLVADLDGGNTMLLTAAVYFSRRCAFDGIGQSQGIYNAGRVVPEIDTYRLFSLRLFSLAALAGNHQNLAEVGIFGEIPAFRVMADNEQFDDIAL